MSITHPQNRVEFKKYIKTRLGDPILEVNVSDEQMDVCIDDAFQWYFGRNHFDGVEDVLLRFRITEEFLINFHSAEQTTVQQLPYPEGSPRVGVDGGVDELVIISAGSEYESSTGGDRPSKTNQPTEAYMQQGAGSGLTVNWGQFRTAAGGLTSLEIYNCGKNYEVGDQVVIKGGNDDCIAEVSKIKLSSQIYGTETFEVQRNFIILPKDVVTVSGITLRRSPGVGLLPAMGTMPFFYGSGNCGDSGFDMVSYYIFQEHIATREWLLYPPIKFNWNQRTHRLYLHTDNFNGLGVGDYLAIEAAIAPSPEIFPDLWDDMFVKKLATAYVKHQWGTNLTKYTQVQLPGGITLNGEGIKSEAQQEIQNLYERFSMDWADPPLDCVG